MLLGAGLEDQVPLRKSEIFAAIRIQITISSVGTAPLLES